MGFLGWLHNGGGVVVLYGQHCLLSEHLIQTKLERDS